MGGRFADSAVANRPIWAPGRRNHLESWFAKGNDPASGRAFWLKYTIWAPIDPVAEAVCETWAVIFDPRGGAITAGKEVRPLAGARFIDGVVDFGAGRRGDSYVEGDIADDAGGRIRWRVDWDGPSTPLVPFAWPWMYRARLPKSKTVTPHPDVRASGWIEFAGERWAFERVPAMQGHNWGTEHAPRYAWGHCNVFEGEDGAWFEGFSARVRIAGRLTPPLSSAFLRLPDGRRFAFNRWGALFGGSASIEDLVWRFELKGEGGHRLVGESRTTADRMAGLTYRNPDGSPLSCLNSKVADLELTLYGPDGGRVAQLVSRGAAALETLTPAQDHPVRMRV